MFKDIWKWLVDNKVLLGDTVKILAIIGGVIAFLHKVIIWIFNRYNNWISKTHRPDLTSSVFLSRDNIRTARKEYVMLDITRKLTVFDQDNPIDETDRKPLFNELDDFIFKYPQNKILFIFAESGMGKSSSLIAYYVSNERRIRRKIHRLYFLSLSKSRECIFQLEALSAAPYASEICILLDALDEDPQSNTSVDARLKDLFEILKNFHKVIISCRTQYFPHGFFESQGTGILRTGAKPLGYSGNQEFVLRYIAPLTKNQTEQIIRKTCPRNKRLLVQSILSKTDTLGARPMIVSYMSLLDPSEIEFWKTTFDIYKAIVTAWLRRENYWVSEFNMAAFSLRCALLMYSNKSAKGSDSLGKDEAISLSNDLGIELADYQITGRSLLIFDSDRNLRFAHRSFLEFFCISYFFEESDMPSLHWTDVMKTFFFEIASCLTNSYGQDFKKKLRYVDLTNFTYTNPSNNCKWSNIEFERSKFSNSDLRQIIFDGICFEKCTLDGSLIGGKLIEIPIDGKVVKRTKLKTIEITNCRITCSSLVRSKFEHAIFQNVVFTECDLTGAEFIECSFEECQFLSCKLLHATGIQGFTNCINCIV